MTLQYMFGLPALYHHSAAHLLRDGAIVADIHGLPGVRRWVNGRVRAFLARLFSAQLGP